MATGGGNLNISGLPDPDDFSTSSKQTKMDPSQYVLGGQIQNEEAEQLMFFFNDEMNEAEERSALKFDRHGDPPRVYILLPSSDIDKKDSIVKHWWAFIHQIKSGVIHDVDFQIVKSMINSESLSTKVLACQSVLNKGMIKLFAKRKEDIDLVKRRLSEDPMLNVGSLSNRKNHARNRPGSLTTDDPVMKLEFSLKNSRLDVKVYKKPITKLCVDVIVNAANDRLDNIGGIAKIIAEAAGREMDKECKDNVRRRGTVADGENRVTSAGKLPYDAIIHAVGPRWSAYLNKVQCLEVLASTITNILKKALIRGYKTVAMPPISSGIFGVPKKLCAAMYLLGISRFNDDGQFGKLEEFHIIDVQDDVLDMVVDWYNKWQHNPSCLDVSSVLTKQYDQSNWARYGRGFNQNEEKRRPRSNSDSCKIVPLKSSTGKTEIKIYTGSILDLKGIDVVVVSDSATLGGEGGLAKALLTAGGPEYKRNRDKIRGSKGASYTEGTVLMCNAGKKLPFSHVFHAIIGRPKTYWIESHLKSLEVIIKLILEKANSFSTGKKVSLAVPMIGTGGFTDMTQISSCCETAEDAIWNGLKNTNNIKHIHLVNQNQEITQKLRDLFQRRVSRGPAPQRPPIVQRKTGTDTENALKGLKLKETWKFENQILTSIDFSRFWKVLRKENKPKGNIMIFGDDDIDVNDEESSCVICLCDMTSPVQLTKCNHVFCMECITDVFNTKPSCPVCSTTYGKIYGDQPRDGTASVYIDPSPLPGHDGETYVINYEFPSGMQQAFHPDPGNKYDGITRTVYLPRTKDGTYILSLLKGAFQQGLTFTIGTSRTTGKEGVITWNDIHHKTSKTGGPQKFGYPDSEYLTRVKEELAAKGLVDD